MLKKNDFVELDFTGKIKDGAVFDTTIKGEAKKAGLEEEKCRPLKICIGQKMLVKGFDAALEGKEAGKGYSIELKPEDAFGRREPILVKTVPLKLFTEKEVMPQPGMLYSFDNILARIVSVSGGRVIVDFNNPLSGKNIVYDFTIKRKIEDIREKTAVIAELMLHLENPKIEVNGEKATMVLEHEMPEKLFGALKEKVNELLNLELSLKVEGKKETGGKAEKKENKGAEEKSEKEKTVKK